MTIFVEYDDFSGVWEITQNGGFGILTTRETRDAAITAGRRYAERGEDVAVKGPRMNEFKQV